MNKISLAALLFCASLYADESIPVCEKIAEFESYTLSDTFGHSVFTKKVEQRACTISSITTGECIRHEERVVEHNSTDPFYNETSTKDFSGTMGSMLLTMNATNKSLDVLTGWSGYCIDGTLMDFGWVQDPYMWASFAMQAFMSADVGGGAFVQEAATRQALISGGTSISVDAAMTIGKITKCAAQNSVQLVQAVDEFASGPKDGPECNPVDEFCSASDEEVENSTFSIERKTYEELISDPNNTSLIKIVSDSQSESGLTPSPSDILIVQIVSSTGLDYDTDSSALDDAKEKIRNIKGVLSAASYAANITACIAGGSAGATTSSGGDSESGVYQDAAKQGTATAISLVGGPFAGMAASVLMNTATSFQSVDTCRDKDDAEERGGRHIATQRILTSKRPEMCRKQRDKKCIEEDPIDSSNCLAWAYQYCCYDKSLSRYLMEELKAQLGKNWNSCADLTLKDLSYVNMRACTDTEKQGGVDGASEAWTIERGIKAVEDGGYGSYYDMAMNTFYQAKYKCINYENIKSYFRKEYAGIINPESLESQLNDMFPGSE